MEVLYPNLQWMKNANRLVVSRPLVNTGSFALPVWADGIAFQRIARVAVHVKMEMNLASFEYSQYSKYTYLKILLDYFDSQRTDSQVMC